MPNHHDNEIALFGMTTYRNKYRKFGIKRDDRRRHMYLIGKTGMGKSTIQENMIVGDIRAGRGVAVVDPHGDLAEKIIEYIPPERINDVIYFNPADMEYPVAFNVVEKVEPHLRHLVASGLIGVFQKLWADSWGPRLEYILRNAILAVLDYPGATLLAVTRMLSDKEFRKKVIDKIQDPVVKQFWVKEFASYADKFASEAVSPIQNKVGQFLSSSLIRNIVGQTKSSIDVRKIMDEGKILILNLSKGRIGEDNSALLGNMMVTKIQLAAMSRVDVPEHERKDFYLYVDEFQNFATDSFANILSEARKYRLSLILAHQYIEQLNEKVAPAVFGNVGTIIVFRVGAADAEELVKEFTPTFTEEDIVNLPKYEMYMKLMIDGVASEPFSARGLPPLTNDEKTGNVEKVINVSRERYAKNKAEVEEKILRWHQFEDDEPDSASSEPGRFGNSGGAKIINKQIRYPEDKPQIISREYRPERNQSAQPNFAPKPFGGQSAEPRKPNNQENRQFQRKPETGEVSRPEPVGQRAARNQTEIEAVCSRCGIRTRIGFVPDGIRPIYCKDCLTAIKDEKKNDLDSRRKAKELELLKLGGPSAFKDLAEPDPQPAPARAEKESGEEGSGLLTLGDLARSKPVIFGKERKGQEFESRNPRVENNKQEQERMPARPEPTSAGARGNARASLPSAPITKNDQNKKSGDPDGDTLEEGKPIRF